MAYAAAARSCSIRDDLGDRNISKLPKANIGTLPINVIQVVQPQAQAVVDIHTIPASAMNQSVTAEDLRL